MTTPALSLSRLEYLVHAKRREEAIDDLLQLLDRLDRQYGQLPAIEDAHGRDLTLEQREAKAANRIAVAVGRLVTDPEYALSVLGYQRLIEMQRGLALIFGASAFGDADHFIDLLNANGYDRHDKLSFTDANLLKFYLLFFPDSRIEVQLDALWRANRALAAPVLLALLSSRLILTTHAAQKREDVLGWLPDRLHELTLDELPLRILHDVWMHCSYADRTDKHRIKGAINALIRRKLEQLPIADVSPAEVAPGRRPVALCIVESFRSNHSIFRTHSLSLAALKRHYRVVGVSLLEQSDEESRGAFDEVHLVPTSNDIWARVRRVRDLAQELQPDVVYYPSVGMFLDTILLVNLRLAPLQCAALGHPATTHSARIDYILVEEDYLGDPACFSEPVVALSRHAIPYRPPAGCPKIPARIREHPDPVRIAVAASLMKINPAFLATLARIARESPVRLEYHFLPLAGVGLAHAYLQNIVRRVLPGVAVVHPQLPFEPYLQVVNSCDCFVNPFPFGNTNGLVDAVRQGLPGVCLSGPEVLSHIDEGLFRRLGLPEWLIAHTQDEYVDNVVRLATDDAERVRLSRHLLSIHPDTVLFNGQPGLFADAVRWLETTRPTAEPGQAIRPPAA